MVKLALDLPPPRILTEAEIEVLSREMQLERLRMYELVRVMQLRLD